MTQNQFQWPVSIREVLLECCRVLAHMVYVLSVVDFVLAAVTAKETA